MVAHVLRSSTLCGVLCVCICVFCVIRVVQELPDLVGMSSLTSLDVTMNNLAFLPTSLGFVTGLVVGW